MGEFKINQFTHEAFQNKRLVAYKCPKCGKVTIRFLILGESNVTHCHWCKGEVEINEVVLVKTICPSCRKRTFMYIANRINEISCYKCKCPIDIIYHKHGSEIWGKSAESEE